MRYIYITRKFFICKVCKVLWKIKTFFFSLLPIKNTMVMKRAHRSYYQQIWSDSHCLKCKERIIFSYQTVLAYILQIMLSNILCLKNIIVMRYSCHFICKKLDFILEIRITLPYYERWFYKLHHQSKWLFSEVLHLTSKRKMVFANNSNTWCAMCKEYISCFKRISLVLSTRYYWEFSDLNIW